MEKVITDHLGKPKPLLLVVVTDGLVWFKDVESVLVRASKKVKSPKELKILFLQIGGDSIAQAIAGVLDDDLISLGANYDIVSSITSTPLLAAGLRRGLVIALEKPTETIKTAQNTTNELAKVRAELARLRATKPSK